MCLLSARRCRSSSSLTISLAHSYTHTHTHTHTHTRSATCFLLPPLSLGSVFKRSQDQTKLENACLAFIWQPCILNPFKRGCRGKKGEKIGHVSHNLCSVNFTAHASTVYRVLRISKPPSLVPCPPHSSTRHPSLPLKPQLLLYFFHPHFCGLCYSDFFPPVLFCVTSEDALPWGG